MEYSNVKGHTDLIRDNSTRAILNNDPSQYDNYLKRRNQRQQGKDQCWRAGRNEQPLPSHEDGGPQMKKSDEFFFRKKLISGVKMGIRP